MTRKLLLPLLTLAALALPARAALPRPTAASFAYGAKLTVTGYEAGKPALSGFPVLVRIAENSPSGFSYGDVQNAAASDWDDIDLAFIDMLGNGLPFEIDTWDTSGESLVWVRLPAMQNGTEFVMCWGSAVSGKTVCNGSPWPDYAGVWHMGETGSGAITIYDSTDNDLYGTADAASAAATGKIGGARFITSNANKGIHGITVDLKADAGKMAVVNALAPQFSASLWFRHTGANPQWNVLLTRRFIEATKSWGIQFDQEKAYSPIRIFGGSEPLDLGAGINGANITSKANLPSGTYKNTWHKLDVVWKSDITYTVYLDGSPIANGDLDANLPARNGTQENLGIGGGLNSNTSTGCRGFYGDMDEVRLGTFAPSDEWVAADYETQTSASFLTAGTAEALTGAANDDPLANLSPDPVQFTNATAKVLVNSLGAGASSATVHVEFAEDAAFASLVKSENVSITAPGTVEVSATGLSSGTTYYVRGSVENGQNHSVSLGPVVFTTDTPGIPIGTNTYVVPGFSTMEAEVYTYAFGKGASTATARLEASTDASFSTFVAGQEVSAQVEAASSVSISGLSPDTVYNLRIRLCNDYGVETFVAVPQTATFAPFLGTGIGWTRNGGSLDFSFGVTEVFGGATVSAVLTYDDAVVGTRTCTAAETLSWTGVAAASGTATATLVVTATLPSDGGAFTKTWTASVTPDGTSTVVNDISDHASAVGALWMCPGDMAMLPQLTGHDSYQVLNPRFASIDGNELTALEPGIVGIRYLDPTGAATVMGVIVLPDAIGSGSVYVFKETASSSPYTWSKSANWDKVENGARAASNNSYPHETDDIAILPFYAQTGDKNIRHSDSEVALGGLYVGQIRPNASVNCAIDCSRTAKRTISFGRSDNNPVRVQICPNSEGSFSSTLTLGGQANMDVDVVWAGDAVIDCGSSETDLNGPRGYFKAHNTTSGTCYCTNTLSNATLTLQGLPGVAISGAGCSALLRGFWRGTGTIVKKGQGGIAFDGDVSGLDGTVCLHGSPTLGGITTPAAQVMLRAFGADNLAADVYGVVNLNTSNGSLSQSGNGNGLLGTGGNTGVDPPSARQAPEKGVRLFGGTYWAGNINKNTWGVGVRDDKELDVLGVGAGVSLLAFANPDNSKKYPIDALTARTLTQTDRGTLGVYEKSRQKVPSQSSTNSLFYVENWESHATGAAGDCVTSSIHPVIPWIITAMGDDWNNVAFASFDADGRLVNETRENCQITQASSEDANLYMTSKNLNYGTAGGDYTINSLYIDNSGNNKYLGTGRTLRIKSGGLILNKSSAIGLPGRADNGYLVLGDASHPAYVWAKAYNANTNYLGAAVTAAGGFVSAYPGNLALVGDQTGIADEIAVNGGTLSIGTAAADCALAEGIPIRVCTGASLLLPTETNAVAASPIKLDGAGKNRAKVILPVNQTCASLAVRDVYESDAWTALPAGTYGSSVSGAEFVRDDLFAGPGVLTVGPAAPSTDVMLLIW